MKVVEMYRVKSEIKAVLPHFLARIAAGYPSPADDYIEECIDLNKN